MKTITACLIMLPFAAPAGADEAPAHHDVLDIHHLPLGDGRISTSPERGMLMSCRRGPGRGGGARHEGPWIHGGTWDLSEKIYVVGKVNWPEAQFAITESAGGRVVSRLITGNGLPVKTPTGTFPISPSDPAYKIDTNAPCLAAR